MAEERHNCSENYTKNKQNYSNKQFKIYVLDFLILIFIKITLSGYQLVWLTHTVNCFLDVKIKLYWIIHACREVRMHGSHCINTLSTRAERCACIVVIVSTHYPRVHRGAHAWWSLYQHIVHACIEVRMHGGHCINILSTLQSGEASEWLNPGPHLL